MHANKHTSFYYHGDASALGGVLTQPIQRTLSTAASVSLAQAGGFHTSRVDRFETDGVLSFVTGHVRVSGSEHKEDGGWRTTATATIEGLNILEVVKADSIVAQVSVMHPYGDRPVEISLNGTQFVNLRVNGEIISPILEPRLFCRSPSKSRDERGNATLSPGFKPCFEDMLRIAEEQYLEQTESRSLFVEELGHRFAMSNPQSALEKRGSALCLLVKGVEAPENGNDSSVKRCGHVLHVPDFGNIFLGEMLVGRNSAQLTMLRVEMGCMAEGTISIGSAFSNGSTMP